MTADTGRRPGDSAAATPARPSTRAQHARYQRVLAEASVLLSRGGEDALQMKELSERACVALATLYRYFPSKQHVILAILTERYEQAHRRRHPARLEGTARERVMEYLLRSFRAQQRDHALSEALHRAVARTGPGPTYVEVTERIRLLYMEQLSAAVGELTEAEQRVLPLVLEIADASTMHWLAGVLSPARVRFQIILASRLLDLSPTAIRADRELAKTTKLAVPTVKETPASQPAESRPDPKQPAAGQPAPKESASRRPARKKAAPRRARADQQSAPGGAPGQGVVNSPTVRAPAPRPASKRPGGNSWT